MAKREPLEALAHTLDRLVSDDHPFVGEPRHAAVCVLIAEVDRVPSVCFIRRARWDGDPWAGHIALPGGSRIGDETPVETVRREVLEEIGVVLPVEAPLLPLPQLRIRLAGRERLLLLDSFLHVWSGTPAELRCGTEIEAAFWTPVAELWSSRNLTCLELNEAADTLLYPALAIPEGTIFGITLRVLTLLSDRIGRPLHYLEEIPALRRKSPVI
jgi:8-oxo-dGTP pyrophosphatase MutT (NUDIX family)